MNNVRALALLTHEEVLKKEHSRFHSGRHGPQTLNTRVLYTNPYLVVELCREIAMHFYMNGISSPYDAVLGVGDYGHVLAHQVAYDSAYRIPRQNIPSFSLPRFSNWADLHPDHQASLTGVEVLIITDLLDDYELVYTLVEKIENVGSSVTGIAAIATLDCFINYTGTFSLEPFSLITLESWEEKNCPLCKEEKRARR